MARKQKKDDVLVALLAAAPPKMLTNLFARQARVLITRVFMHRHRDQKFPARFFGSWNGDCLTWYIIVFTELINGGQGWNRTTDTGVFSPDYAIQW